MPRIFISDKLEAGGIDLLQASGLDIDNRPGLKDAALRDAIQIADGMIVRSGTKVTAQLLENPGKLRAIVRAGVGVDNIDVAAATRKGIVVMNTPGGNTISTAEQTITLMMALARHTPAADASIRLNKWDRTKFVGTQLAGKTLGVVGLGRIGREVARRAVALDMRVIGFDPFFSPDFAGKLGIDTVSDLPSLLPHIDFLTVHTPLSPETTNLIGAAQIGLMKKGSRILNCARGGIINEQALADALQSGHLAGAALDVFVQEPPPADHPLLKLPNVVVTPHLGASTTEAQETVALDAARLLIDYLTKGAVQFAVNMAAIDRAELEEVRLYVDMARRLGLLHAQMAQGAIRKATLTYKGDLAGKKTRLLTAAFTAGLLEGRVEGVNLVNAELVARERGIEIVAGANPKKGDFAAAMQADVETEKKSYTAAGTLFGDQYLRLVQLGPYRMESFLDGTLLVFTHRDVPGLIGFVGTVFGRHGVNIASMTVGRQGSAPGGEAIGVLNLDSVPPAAALAELTHPQLSSVTVVKLPKAGESPGWLG